MSANRLVLAVAIAALTMGCGDNVSAKNNSDDDGSGGGGAAGGSGAVGGGGAGGGSASGAGGGVVGSQPDPQYIPSASGACPDFLEGDVTFAPANIPERAVRIWVGDDPQAQQGPIVFYWHGTGSNPGEATFGLGADTIADIKAQGGIVVAPYHDPAAGNFPWFLTTGGMREDDLLVADEVLACAIDKVGIDLSRIHASGMSAGGLNTVQQSYLRSGYIASVVPYSGGRLGNPVRQEENNKFAAMIFHGGPQDTVIVNFKDLSEGYLKDLTDNGHFGFICDHNMQHTIPQNGAQASVWQFMQDHPFGVSPSLYASALPQGFPAYCSL